MLRTALVSRMMRLLARFPRSAFPPFCVSGAAPGLGRDRDPFGEKILASAEDADVNYPSFHGGETPLMVACMEGHLG